MTPKSIQVVILDDIEARIYRVQQGYRVEVTSTLSDYWHPGIFPNLKELLKWLQPQLETLNAGFPLGGDWMMLEGDFDGNGIYRDWFIYEAQHWQGYDPWTNCCYGAPSFAALKSKIDQIEAVRSHQQALGK